MVMSSIAAMENTETLLAPTPVLSLISPFQDSLWY